MDAVSRRVVHVQAPGPSFEAAWSGKNMVLPEDLKLRPDDVVVLAELGSRRRRSVQGRCVSTVDERGSKICVLAAVLRWDL